ncbi:MAG TPA: hypothetical protein VHM89_07420 [Acidimicrobiales bacterium]|nr:hypothetical protein [Acidimicrobiales bacterium]
MSVTRRAPPRDAVVVTSRTVPAAVAVLAAVTAAPAVVTLVRSGQDFTMALQAAAIVAGAGAGFAADDQAANVLASSPTPLLARRALRAAGVVVVLAGGLCIALAAAWSGSARPVALAGPLSVLAAAAGTSLALASAGGPDGPLTAGMSSAMGSVLGLLTVSALAERWTRLPTVASPAFDRRWLAVAAAGMLTALVRSRDPASRTLR